MRGYTLFNPFDPMGWTKYEAFSSPFALLKRHPLIDQDGKLFRYAVLPDSGTGMRECSLMELLDSVGRDSRGRHDKVSKDGDDKPVVAEHSGSCAISDQPGAVALTTDGASCAMATSIFAMAIAIANLSKAVSTGDCTHAVTAGVESICRSGGSESHSVCLGADSKATTFRAGSHAVATSRGSEASTHHPFSVAVSLGRNGSVSGAIGCWLVCAEWCESGYREFSLVDVKVVKVDGVTIKPFIKYRVLNGVWEPIKDQA